MKLVNPISFSSGEESLYLLGTALLPWCHSPELDDQHRQSLAAGLTLSKVGLTKRNGFDGGIWYHSPHLQTVWSAAGTVHYPKLYNEVCSAEVRAPVKPLWQPCVDEGSRGESCWVTESGPFH